MTTHTPGPWKIGYSTVRPIIEIYRLADDRKSALTIAEIDCSQNFDEAEANARLIAAAPDLLEALEEITRRYALLDARLVAGQHNEPNGTITRARATIAKAKG
jgi:hypothetical protein